MTEGKKLWEKERFVSGGAAKAGRRRETIAREAEKQRLVRAVLDKGAAIVFSSEENIPYFETKTLQKGS